MWRASLILAFSLYCGQSFAAPQFGDFPAQLTGAQKVELQLVDAQSRRYASMLRSAAKRDVDFAGHYILASWGCGASCIMAAAIDTETGLVAWLPFTVCCWSMQVNEPLEFRRTSRLLVVHGSRNEQGAGDEIHYYEFRRNKFKLLPAKPAYAQPFQGTTK